MTYDIASFKLAFGYKAGVVGQLVGVMESQVRKDSSNMQLKSLAEAVTLQNELLEKDAELKELDAKKPQEFLDLIRKKGLVKEIKELKQNPKLDGAEAQLELLQELHQAEQALATSTDALLAGVIGMRIKKAKSLLNVPKTFTTLGGEDETAQKKPSLESVLRGGGELELDKVYKASDGKSYKVSQAIVGGGHSAFKIVDQDSNKAFLWKPAASPMMLEAEVGASKLSGILMPDLCPVCGKVSIDGIDGTCQPFVEGCEELGDVTNLNETQQQQMVAHMLTDWLISNHDNHLKQFMVDGSGNLIGIDKGQAFKHFKHGEVESQSTKKARETLEGSKISDHERDKNLSFIEPEHLDPNYWPKSNMGMPASGDFMKSLASNMRGPDLSSGVVADTVNNAKKLKLKDVRTLFGEYAKEAFPGQEEAFLEAVLDRAHNMDKELGRLQFSAPTTAQHHLETVSELLNEESFVPGSYPKIVDELESLRKAIVAIKKVEGIDTAKDPDPKFALKQKLDKLEAAYKRLAEIDDDCKACEKYLSSDYRRVSPLLASFEAQKVDPAVHQNPKYSYKSIETQLLKDWKRIAVERKLTDKDGAAAWDENHLEDTYEIVRSMSRVWEAFPEPVIPGDKVVRGDVGEYLFKNYPQLDPDSEQNKFEDGEHNVSITLTWPGVMSTTIGKPTEHNFISEKSFIWSFDVQSPCPGRVIGDINPAEQEVTFPVGVKVEVTKLIVRKDDKSQRSGEFGTNAVVIALAKLG
jgi:hypothetical protein